jgi:hypothetical protein
MDALWRELRSLRAASSRISATFSSSLPRLTLRRVNRIASGQLQRVGPDCTTCWAYVISIESKFDGSGIISKNVQHPETISMLKQILLDHDGDILDASPGLVLACWMPSENAKHSIIARLAIQAALKVISSIGDDIVCCVCYGSFNHAIAGGVNNQFVQFIHGDVLQMLDSGKTLARKENCTLMISNTVLSSSQELSSMFSSIVVFGEFSCCSLPTDPSGPLSSAAYGAGTCFIQPDLTCASQQWLLNCLPSFSPDRKFIQQRKSDSLTRFMSICVRLNLGSFLQPPDSQPTPEFTESFVCIQAAIACVQRRCIAVQGELWRIVVHSAEAYIFLAYWFEPDCDFVAIEDMIYYTVHDLNAMCIQFSIGIDSKAAKVVTFGPEARSTVFIQSECVQKSHSIAISCPWNHLQTECPELFPTSAHTTLIRSEYDPPNIFKCVFQQKIHSATRLPVHFERREALLQFQELLEKFADDPHQGVFAICGCFGSGKSHLLNCMQAISDTKGIRSLRCRPVDRSSAPLAAFIPILAHLLEIDMSMASKAEKLQICRSYVRTQMLSDDRDVALLGVIFDFTLENDLLEGLTVAAILEELKSVLSRAFYALGSASNPFILFIENIHLLDSFSWDLLTDLASKKVNIVCEALDAYDTDIFAAEMKSFLRHFHVTKVPLNTVSLDVFEAFLCQKFQCSRVKPEVVSYIRTQSGCRNLFANEWSDYMMMNQSICVVDEELVFSGEYCLCVNPVIPSSVQLLIESDLLRLEESQQLFLKIVAVLGRSFTLEDVCFLSRKQSSKPYASTKKSSTKEAQDTYELCSRLCELGILQPDFQSQEQFTVTYVAPSLLTAAGSTSDAVLHTQRAAGLSCDSVLFWCFQSHIVQNIVLSMLKDDQKKAISLKIASQCTYSSKALTSQAQELAKSSFRIARHMYESGNSVDALAVLHTLRPSSMYQYLRDNVFLCFPPPVLFEVSEDAYIAARLFHVPWIRDFCRCAESLNPLKMRSASPNIQRIASSCGPSSRSTSPLKIQVHTLHLKLYPLAQQVWYSNVLGQSVKAESGVQQLIDQII